MILRSATLGMGPTHGRPRASVARIPIARSAADGRIGGLLRSFAYACRRCRGRTAGDAPRTARPSSKTIIALLLLATRERTGRTWDFSVQTPALRRSKLRCPPHEGGPAPGL